MTRHGEDQYEINALFSISGMTDTQQCLTYQNLAHQNLINADDPGLLLLDSPSSSQ